MEHMSVEEYKKLIGNDNSGNKSKSSKMKNKYGNKTYWHDGLLFQSKKELEDYETQKLLLRSGEIAGFLWQGHLVLVEGGECKEKRAVTYLPDIVVFHNDGTYEIREDKGKRTPAYIIKEKQINNKFPNINFNVY